MTFSTENSGSDVMAFRAENPGNDTVAFRAENSVSEVPAVRTENPGVLLGNTKLMKTVSFLVYHSNVMTY